MLKPWAWREVIDSFCRMANAVGGYLLAFQSLAVEFHHVEMTVVHAGKHFACTAYQQRTSGAEFVVAFIGLEGVGDLVGGAVEHEHAVVVHRDRPFQVAIQI